MAITKKNNNLENRVLVLMPTGRDAALVCAALGKADINAEPCATTEDLLEKIGSGVGAVLMAEEALKKETLERLSKIFNNQPVWSDLPIVLFAGNAQNAEILSATVAPRFNATIVERPIHIPILISAVRGALRAREKQYQSRNLMNQLEESDRQKDLFLATLSHELRTPLNSILGWIQLINGEDSRKHVNLDHALKVIERNARAQTEMISDILFVSRIITGKLQLNLQPVELIPVAENTVEILRPALDAKELRLKINFDSKIKQINGDADRLQQIFWNLLSNAIKFTPFGGKIEFRITGSESNVKVEVIDSGKGINPEFLPFVFERFRQADNSYTRQFGGLGLGLAIVHHLVELHGGTVNVDSAGENCGATFSVTFPVLALEKSNNQSEKDDRAVDSTAEDNHSRKNISILLVEDDDDSRELLKVVFEKNDMEIFSVTSAAQALTAVQEIKPDIVISDIGLPNEDGYELIAKIRQLPPEQGGLTPAIALTGYANLQDRSRALDLGFQEHLPKPVDINNLLEIVNKIAVNHNPAKSK